MQKNKLNRFIQKYNLGGNVNSVKWTAKDNELATSFVTNDKSLMGNVKVGNLVIDGLEEGRTYSFELTNGSSITWDLLPPTPPNPLIYNGIETFPSLNDLVAAIT